MFVSFKGAHIWRQKTKKISVIEFCDDSLKSWFEKLMKIKIDTYSNKGIVQTTILFKLSLLVVFNLRGTFLLCLLNAVSRKA